MSLTDTDLTNIAQTKIFGADPKRIYSKLCQGLDVYQITHLLLQACACGNEILVRYILDRGGYDCYFRDGSQSLLMVEWAKTKEIRALLVNYGFPEVRPYSRI